MEAYAFGYKSHFYRYTRDQLRWATTDNSLTYLSVVEMLTKYFLGLLDTEKLAKFTASAIGNTISFFPSKLLCLAHENSTSRQLR